jgi:anti-sigma factor RsiW
MGHLSEEQLVLHYYDESDAATQAHLDACEACRQEYRRLQRTLNTMAALPVPERPAEYGRQVWERIEGQVGGSRRRWFGWLGWRRLALTGAAAALVAGAFLAGERSGRVPESATVAPGPVRERILLVAVGNHLERSQVVLAELSNLGAGKQGRVDIAYEQRAAGDLVESSRLYRMTASAAGDTGTAAILDDLERVLIDVANGPAEMNAGELERLQKRISETAILFKVRVFASHMDARGNRL